MDDCRFCRGRKTVVDPNISEGMLGTFSCSEYGSLPQVPCPYCSKEEEDQE